MKLLLIKFGKAFGVLKREGIARGGRRILSAFFALFRKIGSGDILFITGGVGDSALYRTHHVSEELSIHGFKCSVTVQDNPLLPSYAEKFKIFIFHRVLYTPKVKNLIGRIKNQNKEIVFDTDDLVYDSKHLNNVDYMRKLNALEKKLYEKGVGGEILNDDYVKICTTTTSYLADKLREKNKKVFIVPNKLSNKDLEVAEQIKKQRKKDGNSDVVRIGYFSGTISHNKDFGTIINALKQIMEKYKNVTLLLAGPLDVGSGLDEFKDRIERIPYVPRSRYFENVAKSDIAVAPLEMGSPFCESKSELKLFEPGILGIPIVAVANQTFSEAIMDGIDGFLARNKDEWVEKLEKLIKDENMRREIGKKARVKTLKDYTNKNSHNEEYYNYLREKIGKL